MSRIECSYENCEIYCNSLEHGHNLLCLFQFGCKEGPSKVMKIAEVTKFTKTAKFTVNGKSMKKFTKCIHLVERKLRK